MSVFCIWAGLALSIIGIIAALAYLPMIWSAVLLSGLALVALPIAADMRRESRESLRRFTPRPSYHWKGSSNEG